MSHEQLHQIYHFVRRALARHGRAAALVTAALSLVALVATLVMPRTYYSEARLFVRFGRENQVDPTATGGQMVSLYESRESEINSLIEILKSRSILDRVVAALGPEYVLYGRARGASQAFERAGADRQARDNREADAGHRPGTTKWSAVVGSPTPDASRLPAHQRAVLRLERDVQVSAPRKSNIITLGCKAASPAAAQRIVAKLVDVYLEEHVRVHRSAGTLEFFQQQTAQSLAAWQRAADELRDTKNRLGIVTIEGQRSKLQEQIADIESKLLANQAELKTSQAKIASLDELIAALPERVVTQSASGPSAAFDGMRQTLYQLETQEQDLAARMQEGHPRLAAIRQQVADLRRILQEQPQDRQQATEALNPARQALELSRLAEQSQADSLVARERSLAASQQQLRRQLEALNSQAIGMEQLQQRVALAEQNHKEYAQRLEQARINRSLDDERISSLSLVQPASYVATPTGPRRAVVLALGLAVALSSGIATALIAAWLNPVLMTAQQVAALLDVPLVGVVPANVPTMAA